MIDIKISDEVKMLQLVTNNFSSLIVALFGISTLFLTFRYQLKRDKINRLDEQRKIAYEEIVSLFMNVLKQLQKPPSEQKLFGKEIFEASKLLVIYGSHTVMSKHKKIISSANKIHNMENIKLLEDANFPENILQNFYLIEELIIEIRKELNPKENLKREDILSFIAGTNWEKFKSQCK